MPQRRNREALGPIAHPLGNSWVVILPILTLHRSTAVEQLTQQGKLRRIASLNVNFRPPRRIDGSVIVETIFGISGPRKEVVENIL